MINEGQQQSLPTSLSPERSALRESAQSLCMACGLCCDGTLFSKVNLNSDDEIVTLAPCGLELLSDQYPPAFKQPCAAYKNCACSAYTNRPQRCRTFRCALLKRFEENKISQTEALVIIREAITLREAVKEAMRPVFGENDCTFNEFTVRLKSRLKNAASAEAKHRISELFGRFAVLWRCINSHFQEQWQQ